VLWVERRFAVITTPTAVREYDRTAPPGAETETAAFGLGCFWGPDAQFGALNGVVRTRVGYAGGTKTDPSYHALGDHTEVFQVDYDPDRRSFADLLDLAFRSHDPDRQTRRTQYRNVVFFRTPEQHDVLRSFLADRDLAPDEIGTRVEELGRFYPAESYHQKYNLKADASLLAPFEEADYDEAAIRESPAAAKLNGHATGKNLPEQAADRLLVRRRDGRPS
jgi:peptide-methionine (S)-S-oxide reductase